MWAKFPHKQVLVRSQSRGHSLGLMNNASYPHTSHVLEVLLGVLRPFARPRFPRLLDFFLCRCRGCCLVLSSSVVGAAVVGAAVVGVAVVDAAGVGAAVVGIL